MCLPASRRSFGVRTVRRTYRGCLVNSFHQLSESVVVFPSLGLQLETHRGFSGISFLASRTFVPWSSLEDFLINEGIRGWDIRYYLVAITRTSQDAVKLEVGFEASTMSRHCLSGWLNDLSSMRTEHSSSVSCPVGGV